MKEKINQTLKAEISKMIEQPEDSISETTHLAELGVDSLQALQLLVLLERTYKIQIGEEELQQFTNIDCISDLLCERAGAALGA